MATRFKRDIFTGELVSEEYEPSPTGRTVLARETPKWGIHRHSDRYRPAISDAKKHVSMALGVHPHQAERFNNELLEYGVTEASYSAETGFLESTDREHRAAAFAIRGHFDAEAGAIEQRYGNAIGF